MFEISDLRRRETLHLSSVCPFLHWGGGGGGREGTLILVSGYILGFKIYLFFFWGGVLWYFHTYVGSGYFGGLNILNFNIFFRKLNIVRGYKDFVDIFLGHHKIGLYLEVLSCILGPFLIFSEGQGTEWRIFFGLLKIQICIWGAWNSWYF